MPVCQVHRPLNRCSAQRLRSCCLNEYHSQQSNRDQDHNNRALSHLPACAAQQLVLRELHSYLILLLWEHPIRVIQHSRQVQRAVAPAPQHSNVALASSPALHQLFLLLATLDALEFVPVVFTGPEWSASLCAQVSQFRSVSANRRRSSIRIDSGDMVGNQETTLFSCDITPTEKGKVQKTFPSISFIAV